MSETNDSGIDADRAKELEKEVEKWKSLARKHEDRAKETYEELQQLKQTQKASQSDMDKLMAKLETMEKRAAEADRKALLAQVKATTGLSDKKIAKLSGETLDELLEDAKETFDWDPANSDAESDDAKGGKKKGDDSKGDDSAGDKSKKEEDPRATSGFGRPQENLTPTPDGHGAAGESEEEDDPLKRADRLLKKQLI